MGQRQGQRGKAGFDHVGYWNALHIHGKRWNYHRVQGKLATRTIPVIADLHAKLTAYTPRRNSRYLFPGNELHSRTDSHLHRDSAMWLLREACIRVGIEGVSTHSFRRTALTQMSNAGIPLRVIQEISGHRTLDELYKYLEGRRGA